MRRFASAICVAVASLAAAAAHAAVQTVTNTILQVQYEDTTGQFTVKTGTAYPGHPDAFVIFPIGTSFISLVDNTAQIGYTNDSGQTPPPGFTYQSLRSAPCTAATAPVTMGFTATYTCPNWTVVQTVTVQGTTLADTAVRQTVAVTNTSGVTRSYGVRYMWDWYINSNDASIFRTRNPDTPFTSTFVGYTNPTFQAFEEVDNATTPSFSVFGTITGGPLVPPPTTPDRFGYVSWSTADDFVWDFPITGSGEDSATIHFFGFTTPLSLAAGATSTFVEYMTTQATAIGVTPSGPSVIPTLTDWGIIALAALLGIAGLVSLRRRGAF